MFRNVFVKEARNLENFLFIRKFRNYSFLVLLDLNIISSNYLKRIVFDTHLSFLIFSLLLSSLNDR